MLHHLLGGRLLHFDDGLRTVQAREHLGEQMSGGRVEGEREARAAGGDIGGEPGAAGAREPHRLGIALVHRGNVAELDRLRHPLELIGRQRVEEALAILLRQQALVQHCDDAAILCRADEPPEALFEA